MTTAQNAFLISYLLQAAVAFAFTVALAGLAAQLRRPGARILTSYWVLATATCIVGVVEAATQEAGAMLITGPLSYLAVALVCATVPVTHAAAIAVASGGKIVPRYLGWALLVGALASVAAIVVTWLGEWIAPAGSQLRLVIPRLLVVVAFGGGAVAVWRVRASAPERYRLVLAIYAAGALAQLPRPFLAVALEAWARDAAVRELAGALFIVQHVLALVILGVTSFLLALTEERLATFDQGRQLRETALRLERSHRLESLGRLAGGVAHDFNNLLGAIRASSELARASLGDPDEVRVELDAIEDASTRGVALTRQLKDYARVTPREPERFDVGARLATTGAFLRRLVEPQVALQLVPASASLAVRMDPTQFDQVLMNLVVNARDAMPEGGTVTVRAEEVVLDVSREDAEIVLSAGVYARLTVHDIGIGVPPELARAIFEPFFTTRASAGGTGLGLATVLSAVRAAQGDVRVESRPETGTTFEVILPLAIAP